MLNRFKEDTVGLFLVLVEMPKITSEAVYATLSSLLIAALSDVTETSGSDSNTLIEKFGTNAFPD